MKMNIYKNKKHDSCFIERMRLRNMW